MPEIPPWVRFAVAGVILACLAYATWFLNRVEQNEADPNLELERIVSVPELDEKVLAEIDDKDRSARLLVEREPLRHLLAKSIDVGPSAAAALDIPADMVPVATLREAPDKWRLRWLWYEGKLVRFAGPRPGHPIEGYSIYEATIELADGEHVLAAISVAPATEVEVGQWVRVEGYLFKMRDLTYPEKLESVPMLVGRTLQRDYEDWPKVTELDHELLDSIDDSSFWMGDLPSRTVDEDQSEALWHLGAFVRDTADQWDLQKWRKVEPLSVAEPFDRLVNEDVARGEPMRVFGTLIRRQTIAAPANPANIKFWTAVWVQASGFGGLLVPIWVPGKVADLPMRAQLEVRGFYYRWFVYNTQKGKRQRVPLFLAADLDVFELDTDGTMRTIGIGIGCTVTLFVLMIFWAQRRAARSALEHSRQMDARRRRRRERQTAATTES